MDDPLLAALESGSPKAIALLADRLERLAGVRHRMRMLQAEVQDTAPLKRASQAVLEALDVHVAVLQATLRDAQASTFEAAAAQRIRLTWERLVVLQRTLSSGFPGGEAAP